MSQKQDLTPNRKKLNLGHYLSDKFKGKANNDIQEVIKKLPNSEDISKLMNLINENSSMKNKINYLESKIKKYEFTRTRLKPRPREARDEILGTNFSTKTSSNMKVINHRSQNSCQSCKGTTYRDLTTFVQKSESKSKSNRNKSQNRFKTTTSKQSIDNKHIAQQSSINKIKYNLSKIAQGNPDIYKTINQNNSRFKNINFNKIKENIKIQPGLLKVNFDKKDTNIIVPSKDGSYCSKKKSKSLTNKLNNSKKSQNSVQEEGLESFSSRRKVHPKLKEGLKMLSSRIKSLIGSTKRMVSKSMSRACMSVRENYCEDSSQPSKYYRSPSCNNQFKNSTFIANEKSDKNFKKLMPKNYSIEILRNLPESDNNNKKNEPNYNFICSSNGSMFKYQSPKIINKKFDKDLELVLARPSIKFDTSFTPANRLLTEKSHAFAYDKKNSVILNNQLKTNRSATKINIEKVPNTSSPQNHKYKSPFSGSRKISSHQPEIKTNEKQNLGKKLSKIHSMENLHNLPLDYNAEIALQKFKSNKVGKLSVILDSNRYIENHEQFLNYTTNMTTKNKGTKKPRKNIKDQRMLDCFKKKGSSKHIKKSLDNVRDRLSINVRDRLSNNNKSLLFDSILQINPTPTNLRNTYFNTSKNSSLKKKEWERAFMPPPINNICAAIPKIDKEIPKIIKAPINNICAAIPKIDKEIPKIIKKDKPGEKASSGINFVTINKKDKSGEKVLSGGNSSNLNNAQNAVCRKEKSKDKVLSGGTLNNTTSKKEKTGEKVSLSSTMPAGGTLNNNYCKKERSGDKMPSVSKKEKSGEKVVSGSTLNNNSCKKEKSGEKVISGSTLNNMSSKKDKDSGKIVKKEKSGGNNNKKAKN